MFAHSVKYPYLLPIISKQIYIVLIKLATKVKGDFKALFSIDTTPRYRKKYYSIPRTNYANTS